MSRAEDVYKLWHARNPDANYKKRVAALTKYKNAYPIGIGHEIGYSSDKWEDKAHLYIHDFKKPKVYLLENNVIEGEEIGKSRTVLSLLGLRKKPSGALPLAFLGVVTELTYKAADGQICEFTHVNGAELLSSPDKKALLILSKKGPIIVRGGTMSVTARGIVD